MSDARTEARRRIAVAVHRLVCSGCTGDGCEYMDESDWDVADAVVELFPIVSWSTVTWDRYLTLYGPAEPMILTEPVTEEREP